MARNDTTLRIVNENNRFRHDNQLEMDAEIEMIFGKPPALTDNISDVNNRTYPGKPVVHNNDVSDRRTAANDNEAKPTEPLLGGLREAPMEKPKPPLAGPEIDDLDGDPPSDAAPFPGIDDGLLEPSDNKPQEPDLDDDDHSHRTPDVPPSLPGEAAGTDGKPWSHDEPDNPYDNGFGHNFGVDSRAMSPVPGTIPDVNTYQQKKNLAQGMMDLALLSANANQLRYVIESNETHPYYYFSIVSISLSIVLQIAVGVGLILNSRYDVNHDKDLCKADKISNLTVLGIFLITAVNVFITAFSVATPTTLSSLPSSP